MATLVSSTITPLSQVGVFRVLTQDFLHYRKNALLRAQPSSSDTEEVRWVSLLNSGVLINYISCLHWLGHSGWEIESPAI